MDSTNSRSCSRICKRLYYSKERRQFPHRKPLRLLKALLNKMGQSTAHGLKRRLRSFKSMVSLFMVIQVELSEHVMQNRNITSFSLIKSGAIIELTLNTPV